MATKKKPVKKEVEDIKEQSSTQILSHVVIDVAYKPVFPSYVEEFTDVKYDLNRVGIKRKLDFLGISFFNSMKKEKKSINNFNINISDLFSLYIIKIQTKIETNTAWQKYCKLWNKFINKMEEK